ncbi:phosphotransferase [Actinosynnema sp. NPDC047251]|uniref:Aminoglycoside phosphotransferase n=1 Tax=Saccharothrix espanaensis (strain ATCC 51144 / DSM 44229 / JCM 9112 / NBRC 15066 / NRRL 15764) TaxID=1179773 RepID=K0K7B2_SACES|nr:phosphotransferase [Saccharothrix espanaensis]CCH32493.1 Aminoglycoside phosphotransferase [Saccharothrix espanaensis DSM 44229]
MEAEVVWRATAAATALAGELRLRVGDAVVIQDSNMLALRLLPCGVFARVAQAGQEVAAFEVELAGRLAATASPVAALDPRVEPRVYERHGFAVTFWTYHDTVTPDPDFPGAYADALHHLHAGMRHVETEAPHILDRVAEAERPVTHPDDTPALTDTDRHLLLDTLRSARERIRGHGAAEQLLHGEPHPGNLLNTRNGPLFIDLETCCRGPVEFDVAHVPEEIGTSYPDIDHALLAECRRLVLGLVAAWRWNIRDNFPNGRRHGQNIPTLLRKGPPWPTLGTLTTE